MAELKTGLEARVKNFIEFEDARKRIGEQEILRGVSLTVQTGTTVAVLGASGAGKTTICNLVARFTAGPKIS